MENTAQIAQQTKPVSAITKFNSLLGQSHIKAKFDEALGKKAPIFVSNLTTIMAGSAELQKCEHMSIISSALMAASMDLPLTPGLGFAGIVPYWDPPSGSMKAQFQVMKKGYIQLAQRTGLFKIINVSEVYEGELKSHNKFTGEYVFDESGKKSDTIIGYVSYFRLVNGFEKYLYMPIEKLDAHAKKYSKSFQKGKGKWADKSEGGYEQMCEKTVLKLNLSTYAPLSVDINMMNAIIYDQAEIRDVDAKDFDYVDNENTNKIENKEVLEIGENKTLTINQTSTAKSQAISQSVTNTIDKTNGIPQGQEQIAEAVIVQETPKPILYSEEELTAMKDGIYEAIKGILPAAKVTILESFHRKRSNKQYREAILAYQAGTIDKWLTDQLQSESGDKNIPVDASATSGEIVPQNEGNDVKKENSQGREGSDLDKLFETKPGGISQKEVVAAFNAEGKQPQGNGSLFPDEKKPENEEDPAFIVLEINPATGRRDFKNGFLVNQKLKGIGITDAQVVEFGFQTLDSFCVSAKKEDIEVLIQKNM